MEAAHIREARMLPVQGAIKGACSVGPLVCEHGIVDDVVRGHTCALRVTPIVDCEMTKTYAHTCRELLVPAAHLPPPPPFLPLFPFSLIFTEPAVPLPAFWRPLS